MKIWETCREFSAKGPFFFYISWRTFNFSATAKILSHNVLLGTWNLDSSCRPKFFLPKIQNFNACRPKILVKKYLIEKFNFPKNLVWTVEYGLDNPTFNFYPKIWSFPALLLKEKRNLQEAWNTSFFFKTLLWTTVENKLEHPGENFWPIVWKKEQVPQKSTIHQNTPPDAFNAVLTPQPEPLCQVTDNF